VDYKCGESNMKASVMEQLAKHYRGPNLCMLALVICGVGLLCVRRLPVCPPVRVLRKTKRWKMILLEAEFFLIVACGRCI
jgi:hypothetical protein